MAVLMNIYHQVLKKIKVNRKDNWLQRRMPECKETITNSHYQNTKTQQNTTEKYLPNLPRKKKNSILNMYPEFALFNMRCVMTAILKIWSQTICLCLEWKNHLYGLWKSWDNQNKLRGSNVTKFELETFILKSTLVKVFPSDVVMGQWGNAHLPARVWNIMLPAKGE